MGGMPPGEGMPGGPMPPGFFQVSHLKPVHCLAVRDTNQSTSHLCYFKIASWSIIRMCLLPSSSPRDAVGFSCFYLLFGSSQLSLLVVNRHRRSVCLPTPLLQCCKQAGVVWPFSLMEKSKRCSTYCKSIPPRATECNRGSKRWRQIHKVAAPIKMSPLHPPAHYALGATKVRLITWSR